MGFLKVFDVIPGWVYAAAVAVLLLALGAAHLDAAVERADAAVARADLQSDRAAAQGALARQTALVLKATNELQALRAVQEKKDAQAKETIAALRDDLRARSRAAGGPGLRDPNATACSGQPAAPAGPAAAAGGADAAEAGGVLSAELEGLLLRLTSEADDINAAYASCRADAVMLREKFQELQRAPLSPPSPGPASTGSP